MSCWLCINTFKTYIWRLLSIFLLQTIGLLGVGNRTDRSVLLFCSMSFAEFITISGYLSGFQFYRSVTRFSCICISHHRIGILLMVKVNVKPCNQRPRLNFRFDFCLAGVCFNCMVKVFTSLPLFQIWFGSKPIFARFTSMRIQVSHPVEHKL